MIESIDAYIERKMQEAEVVILQSEARKLLERLRAYDNPVALDFETTSLHPISGRVRLTALYDHIENKAYVIDHDLCGAFNLMVKWGWFSDQVWLVYNAKFEQRWFDFAADGEVDVLDVDFFRKCMMGGWPSSLAKMARYDLEYEISKELQASDWGKKHLTTGQYQYAAGDAVVTYLLAQHWVTIMKEEGVLENMTSAVWDMQSCVRATIECEDTGIGLDPDYHQKNIDRWTKRAATCLFILRRYTPLEVLKNPNSNKQVSDLLKATLDNSVLENWPKTEKTEQLDLSRGVVRPFARRLPFPLNRWLNAFCSYRYYNKYLTTYGETLLTKHHLAGVINFRLNIAQAATGRYSSSSINIQNIPRSPVVRKAFLPPEPFEFIVAADYSSIEVRVLAELSGDKGLIHDAIHGDVHATMAAARMGIPVDEFIKRRADGERGFSEARSRAKAGTFRLTYGAGAGAIADSLGSTLAEAEEFLRKWAEQYPVAYNYRFGMNDLMMNTGFLPVAVGRRVYVPKKDRQLPVAANYPIQGAAATVMMRAMYHVRNVRDELSTRDRIALVATVHDEMLLACDEKYITTAKKILHEGMLAGWLDVFPDTDTTGLIESGHGRTWGDAK